MADFRARALFVNNIWLISWAPCGVAPEPGNMFAFCRASARLGFNEEAAVFVRFSAVCVPGAAWDGGSRRQRHFRFVGVEAFRDGGESGRTCSGAFSHMAVFF